MEDDDDIEYLYEHCCPKCQHSPLKSRQCSNLFCQDGFVDCSDDDPINYQPGEEEYRCKECFGTGFEVWCPECGEDLTKKLSEL